MNLPLPPNATEALDKTLDALGAAMPSPGMNQRLLAALQARELEAPRPSRVPRFARPLALTLSAALLLSLALLHHPAKRTPRHPTPSHLAAVARQSSAPAAEPNLAAAPLPQTPIHLTLKLSAPVRSAPAASLHTEPSLDEAALADLNTPSYPAPPLPPTAQERLVRLMLRRGERHDLAQLDPARSAAFAQQQDEALEQFFNPPLLPPPAAGLPPSAPPPSSAPVSPATQTPPRP